MPNNSLVILDRCIEEYVENLSENFTDSKKFELFCFEQILKNYNLSFEEIIWGHTDGTNDGGIDGFYFFVNGILASEENLDLDLIGSEPKVELFIIQVKSNSSFPEDSLMRMNDSIKQIFDLTNNEEEISNFFNEKIVNLFNIFKQLYLTISTQSPTFETNYIYVSKGNTRTINNNLIRLSENIKTSSEEMFFNSAENNKFNFYGANELISMYRKMKNYTLEIEYSESPITAKDNSFIILCSLQNYYQFITDDNNQLKRYLFESNVRDYQNSVEVNKEIRLGLESNENTEFWWLNNGVTIISQSSQLSANRKLIIKSPQIVNGLQTTEEVYRYISDNLTSDSNNEKMILIRIITAEDEELQNQIIKATNFQTAIQKHSFRANDKIQIDIETFLFNKEWFYDRRKNYYKNQKKPLKQIISPQYLAQGFAALILKEPHIAKSSPSSLFKDDYYNRIFNESSSLPLYLFVIRLMKRIEEFTNTAGEDGTLVNTKTNLKYHIGYSILVIKFNTVNYTPNNLLETLSSDISDSEIINALAEAVRIAYTYQNMHSNIPINSIVKKSEFTNYLKQELTLLQVGSIAGAGL